MSIAFNLPIVFIDKCSYMQSVETLNPAEVSKKAAPIKNKAKSFSKPFWFVKGVKKESSDRCKNVKDDEMKNNDVTVGPNKDWIPNAT